MDNKLNQDSNRMNNCAFDRKMSFNPDHWKQVQNIFSQALIYCKINYSPVSFNNNTVTQSLTPICLGMFLVDMLDFQEH